MEQTLNKPHREITTPYVRPRGNGGKRIIGVTDPGYNITVPAIADIRKVMDEIFEPLTEKVRYNTVSNFAPREAVRSGISFKSENPNVRSKIVKTVTSEIHETFREPNAVSDIETRLATVQKMVAVDSVIRCNSYVVGTISFMSIIATKLSDTIIIQPIFATLLLIASVGFYSMTLVRE